ncbi:MAG: hypothetical protein U1F76_29485 [Candidatus Competibacteraceae bacterium]
MRSLLDVLVTSGLDLTGWWLTEATAISADGLTIGGYGRNPAGLAEGWIATLEPALVPEIQATMATTGLALLVGGLLLLGEGTWYRRSPAGGLSGI